MSESVKNIEINIMKHVLRPQGISLDLIEKFLEFLRILQLRENVLIGLLRSFQVDLGGEEVRRESVVHVSAMDRLRVHAVVLVKDALDGSGIFFYCDACGMWIHTIIDVYNILCVFVSVRVYMRERLENYRCVYCVCVKERERERGVYIVYWGEIGERDGRGGEKVRKREK